MSIAGDLSAGEIFGNSGVGSVIITGSLTGSGTVRLDNSGSSEEAADSITISDISSGVVYGESGADTFNISGDAVKASIYGGAQNDSVTIGGSLSVSLVEAGEGADTLKIAKLIESTVKGEAGDDLVEVLLEVVSVAAAMATAVMTLHSLRPYHKCFYLWWSR